MNPITYDAGRHINACPNCVLINRADDIRFCKLHASAPHMKKALKALIDGYETISRDGSVTDIEKAMSVAIKVHEGDMFTAIKGFRESLNCTCSIEYTSGPLSGSGEVGNPEISYCHLHFAAPALLEACMKAMDFLETERNSDSIRIELYRAIFNAEGKEA